MSSRSRNLTKTKAQLSKNEHKNCSDTTVFYCILNSASYTNGSVQVLKVMRSS